MSLRVKLDARMDKLQSMMESNTHLTDPNGVNEHIGTITFAWTVLSEEDRDYIQGCQYAIEEQTEWKLS